MHCVTPVETHQRGFTQKNRVESRQLFFFPSYFPPETSSNRVQCTFSLASLPRPLHLSSSWPPRLNTLLHSATLSESHLKEPPPSPHPPPLPPGIAGSPPVDRRAARRCGGCSSCSGRWCPSTARRSDG